MKLLVISTIRLFDGENVLDRAVTTSGWFNPRQKFLNQFMPQTCSARKVSSAPCLNDRFFRFRLHPFAVFLDQIHEAFHGFRVKIHTASGARFSRTDDLGRRTKRLPDLVSSRRTSNASRFKS